MVQHVDENTLRTRALMYARAARAQVETFAEAERHLRTAYMHTIYRSQIGNLDPQGATTRWTYGGAWDFSTAHYLALVLVAQVARVVDRLDLDVPLYPGETPVKLLRDLEEHWDEIGGTAMRNLRLLDPEASPGRIWFGGDRVMVGDATVEDLQTWLHEVTGALYVAAERAGQPLPSEDDEVPRGT